MLKLACCISIFITHSPSIQNMKKTPNKTKKQFLFYINIFDPHLIKTPPPPLLILDTFVGPCPTIGSLPRLTHTQTHKHTNTHTNTYTHTHTHTYLALKSMFFKIGVFFVIRVRDGETKCQAFGLKCSCGRL